MLSDTIKLVSVTRSQDAAGIWSETESETEILATVDSVSRTEWAEAARIGLKAEYRFTVFAGDYNGEETCEYHGTTYGIYRTYRASLDRLELYAERKSGAQRAPAVVTNGNQNQN